LAVELGSFAGGGETADDRVTRFVWLRQFEPGSNSSSANRLLDRLEYLQRLDLPEDLLARVPAHRVTRLRRQGERYYADGMRDLQEDRRLAILAVCASEWQAMLADAVVETHDRIVGRLYRASERICHAKIADEATAVRATLKSFAEIGGALFDAQDDGQPLDEIIASGSGWEGLKTLVATAISLTATMSGDPLNHVLDGYHRFRRYAPRMLRLLDLRAAPVAAPLLEAVIALRGGARVPIAQYRSDAASHRPEARSDPVYVYADVAGGRGPLAPLRPLRLAASLARRHLSPRVAFLARHVVDALSLGRDVALDAASDRLSGCRGGQRARRHQGPSIVLEG